MDAKTHIRLRQLRHDIACKLLEIEDILPPEYRLTLVARHDVNPDAHIIVSVEQEDENLLLVCDVIQRVVADPDSFKSNQAIGVNPV